MNNQCSIETLCLRCTIFQIFDFKNCRDFEIRVRGHSKSLKVVPFDRLGIVSYWTSNYTVTLKPCDGAGGAEGAVAPPLADKGANSIKCPSFYRLSGMMPATQKKNIGTYVYHTVYQCWASYFKK